MLTGAYFDGHSARRHIVRLAVVSGALEVSGEGIALRLPLDQLRLAEPMGAAPRLIELGEMGSIEAPASPEVDTLWAELRPTRPLLVRLQTSWGAALVALSLMVMIAVAAYRWGLPWAAEQLAPHIPQALSKQLSEKTLETLDAHALRPSTLPRARQDALRAAFARLVATDPEAPAAQLVFRSAPKQGPNAFALPDGQIVIFDQLVALSDQDDEILAVLAHELGHVRYRHGLRQGIQSSVVSAVAAAWLGDLSSMASFLGTLALTSGYSRGMEEEADDYSQARFRALSLPENKLVSMLEKLEAEEQKRQGKVSGAAEKSAESVFSTHPETAERIRRLRSR